MRADNDAVKAKYESVAALASKVFVVEAPHDTELPYAVLYPMGGQDTTDRLNGTGPRITRHPRFTVHIFGESADQVQVIADLVKPKFIQNGRGLTLAVAGWINQPAWYEEPLPLQKDTDVQPTVIFHVAELGWRSDPDPTI
jgi:hypothetical protein